MKTLLILLGTIILVPVVALALFFGAPYLMQFRICYFTKGDKVYYRTTHSWKWFTYATHEVKEADYGSFKKISRRYASDKDHVFYDGTTIENCDPASFSLIDNYNGISRDSSSVFIGDQLVSKDPNHFVLVGGGYTKDRYKIYRGRSEAKGFDVASFYLFDGHPNFPADKNHIRYQHKTIEGADIESFQILEKGYSKDKNHVYYLHRIKEGLNPQSFAIN